MIGKMLDNRYELLEVLGSGGMAVVYKAKCHLLNRFVAIKILKQEFSEDSDFVRKFRRESQAAASLSHPNIVNVYDVGNEIVEGKQIYYIVMEYIDGRTLKEIIEEKGYLSEEKAIEYSLQIGSALEDAHNNKIIHRDIKPQNIMVNREDRIKVTDFGIARAASSSTLTTTADVLGSVHYLSPEQARGGYTDEKSDIYSLGIVLYEMVTGKLPYDGDTPISIALKHVEEEIKKPRDINPNISEAMEAIILKAVAKRTIDRYSDIKSMTRDLKKISTGSNSKRDIMLEVDREDNSKTILIPQLDNKEEVDLSQRKKKKSSGGFKVILLAVLLGLIVSAGYFFGKHLFNSQPGNESIEVPDFIEMTEEEAKDLAGKLGLNLIVGENIKNEKYENGQVGSQSVEGGMKIRKNFPITINIVRNDGQVDQDNNEEEDKLIVPDLTDLSVGDAEKKLKEAGFVLGKVSEEFSAYIDEGKVMSQSILKFKEAEEGSKIDIIISKGEEANKTTMPKLIGKSLEEAKKIIEENKLKLGEVKEEESDKKKGTVLVQSLPKGQEIEEGLVVDLSVSLGNNEGESEENPDEGTEKDPNQGGEKPPIEEDIEGPFIITINSFGDLTTDVVNVQVVRVQDGETKIVYDQNFDVDATDVSLNLMGKKGSEFQVYFNGELKSTSVKTY